jgi:hypothetical protein
MAAVLTPGDLARSASINAESLIGSPLARQSAPLQVDMSGRDLPGRVFYLALHFQSRQSIRSSIHVRGRDDKDMP